MYYIGVWWSREHLNSVTEVIERHTIILPVASYSSMMAIDIIINLVIIVSKAQGVEHLSSVTAW